MGDGNWSAGALSDWLMLKNVVKRFKDLTWINNYFLTPPTVFSHQLYGLSLSRIFYDTLSRSQFYYSGTFLLWRAWRKAANWMWKDKFTFDCFKWRYSVQFKSQVVQSKVNWILCLYMQIKKNAAISDVQKRHPVWTCFFQSFVRIQQPWLIVHRLSKILLLLSRHLFELKNTV